MEITSGMSNVLINVINRPYVPEGIISDFYAFYIDTDYLVDGTEQVQIKLKDIQKAIDTLSKAGIYCDFTLEGIKL